MKYSDVKESLFFVSYKTLITSQHIYTLKQRENKGVN